VIYTRYVPPIEAIGAVSSARGRERSPYGFPSRATKLAAFMGYATIHDVKMNVKKKNVSHL
jgi:hypothetical protein